MERYSGTTRAAHEDNQMTRGPPITLPYVRGISEAVRRILRPLGVRVTFKPTITLKQLLVKPKDQVPDRERANVVYQVPCANCPATYVGQTGRRLNQRLREHRRAVESGDCANSALAEHAWGCHHPVDWDHLRVLDGHPHLYQRLTLESVHIRSQSNPVNRDLGTMPQVYNPLVQLASQLHFPTD